MVDIQLARKILEEKRLSLVITKDGKILFESRSSGIRGLLKAIDILDKKIDGSSVADRVIGRAAALLLSSYNLKVIHVSTLSFGGLKVLKENSIPVKYDTLVPVILNMDGNGICPFEEFAMTIDNPQNAFLKLKVFSDQLSMITKKS